MAACAQTNDAAHVRWISAAALAALAAHRKTRAGATFTIEQLRAWDPALRGPKAAHATDKLKRMEFIRSVTPGQYVLTGDGAAAVQAAAQGHVLRSGQHGPKNRPPDAASFAARLWALLRARRVIDSGTAAATLVDAGNDVAAAETRAQAYLRKWERAGLVTSSARRLPGGRKQYVLIKDTPHPPCWEQLRQLAERNKEDA